MMYTYKLTSAHEQCLRDQVITADQPGTVLRDFRMLLDFIGPEGVETSGKYNLLPIKLIGELNNRLSRPLNLKLERPQLRSHPYLQGLNLLLRASSLTCVDQTGAKARLVVDPAMLEQFECLNPTEQYFNLLEGWLRIGRQEMVGDQGSSWGGVLTCCRQTWRDIPEEGRRFDRTKPQDVYLQGVGRDFYLLALMELFGLVEVEQPRPSGAPWYPGAVKHVPFGDAVFMLITSRFDVLRARHLLVPEDDVQDEKGPSVPRFGAWQPLFQPYFPEWRENLKVPQLEPREGTFIFRVSLGEVWRLIAMPAECTLDDLVDWILRSVKWDSDHLHKFTYRDRLGREVSISHSALGEGASTDQTPIGTLPLEPGQTMQLLYDFGDNWEFTVKLERVEPPAAMIKAPYIREKHGKSPAQYPRWEEF